MECHTDYSYTMKEIDVAHAFKSWYFFFIKSNFQ